MPFSIAASRNATMSGFQLEQKRDRRKQINPEPPSDHAYKCNECDRICKSRIAGPLSNKTEFHLCETRWSFHRLLKTNRCQQRNEQYRIKNLRRNKKLKAGNVCGRRRVSVRSFYLLKTTAPFFGKFVETFSQESINSQCRHFFFVPLDIH